MPNVRGKKFPYTKAGMAAAKKEKKKLQSASRMARKVKWVVARYEQKRTHKPQAIRTGKGRSQAQVQEMAQCLFSLFD